jgi:hypothetical protein
MIYNHMSSLISNKRWHTMSGADDFYSQQAPEPAHLDRVTLESQQSPDIGHLNKQTLRVHTR